MRAIIKSSFFWRFVGGFALGAIGVVSLHPGALADTIHHAVDHTLATPGQ